MLHWIKNNRRGSILVIVVAILTMIALIGTAYIATTRMDRYSTREYVDVTDQEANRDQYAQFVQQTLQRTIANDYYNPVTSPKTIAWLGDRLPQNIGAPLWRYVSGPIHGNIQPIDFQSPLATPDANGAVRLFQYPQWAATAFATPNLRPSVVPMAYTVQYPGTMPPAADPRSVRYANKVRSYPAVAFWDQVTGQYMYYDPSNGTPVYTGTTPYPYVAGDADGDGIADSLLVRITPSPIKGVTYYAAVRIIDNSSAINVNTAWSRDNEYPANAAIRTYFLSNVGLRELFGAASGIPGWAQGNQMMEINVARFNYTSTATANSAKAGTTEAAISVSTTPAGDPNVLPAAPTNFNFLNQGEAMSMQLGRRILNPGYDSVTNRPYVAYLGNDAAALAYRNGMVPVDPGVNDLEPGPFDTQILCSDPTINPTVDPRKQLLVGQFDGAVRAAPNYAVANSNRSRYFPATEALRWFNTVNFDFANTLLFDNAANALYSDATGTHFRSVRPILTTYNAVSSRVANKKTNSNANFQSWHNGDVSNLLYPGQSYGDNAVTASAKYGKRYKNLAYGNCNEGDIGYDPASRRCYMALVPNPGIAPITEPDPTFPKFWDYQGNVSGDMKTSINTAGFPELWRAFFQTMGLDRNPVTGVANQNAWVTRVDGVPQTDAYDGMRFAANSPFAAAGPLSLRYMFRSSVRDPNAAGAQIILTPLQMMALRSAQAAVNAVSMIDNAIQNNVSTTKIQARRIVLYDPVNPRLPQYEAVVYGLKPQPFITEIYANNDIHPYVDPNPPGNTYKNQHGYVAIELYNPFDVSIDISGWAIAVFNRDTASFGGPNAKITQLTTVPPGTTIAANNYKVLEGYVAGSGYRPPAVSSNISNMVSMPQLVGATTNSVFGQEMILMPPRDPLTPGPIENWVPVDQFDFTGMTNLGTDGPSLTWHYVRDTLNPWKCVYPGRYDGTQANRRHQGTDRSCYNTTDTYSYDPTKFDPTQPQATNFGNQAIDPWNPSGTAAPWQLGNGTPPSPPITLGTANSTPASQPATYPNGCTISLKGLAYPGATAQYPYGGFARNGDILQVPFIGAYRIRRLGPAITPPPAGNADLGSLPAGGYVNSSIVEMNSITMDSAFAEDTNTANNDLNSSSNGSAEQVGRFCPLITGAGYNSNSDPYGWANQLFGYMDVLVPSDDYLPNINPSLYAPVPQPVVSNTGQSVANQNVEDGVGLHGRINISTASAKVMSMLPFVPVYGGPTDGAIDVANTELVARGIETYRNNPANPPFASAFDLQQVASFTAQIPGGKPGVKEGYLLDGSTSLGAKNDFGHRFLMLNRISNLITTRSDTFTCYVLVQGWRDAGTSYATLDWEQRKAFIIDRSFSPPRIIQVPTD